MELDPQELDCKGGDVTLDVEISNTGTRDQKKVVVDLKSTKLNLFKTVTPFRLDESDEETLTFAFQVPQSTTPGTYNIEVITFLDVDEESDREIATLKVNPCVTPNDEDEIPEEEEEEEQDEDVIYTDKPPVIPPSNVVIGTPKEEEKEGISSTMYITLLALGIIIVLLLIVLLFAAMFKK
jgi:hypothetical protein